ncbi:hypothetical protein K469DRAFT_556764, partial [Zopfia rhizophila CBS 207.26]
MAHFGSYKDTERRIELALGAVASGECRNLNEARIKYHVPKNRLYARAQGTLSKLDRPGTNKRLDEIQESALINYIKRCDELGFSVMPHMIHDAAEVILNAGSHPPFLPQYLGRDWVTRFLAAHPELIKKKQK